jgi:hypothetical protein
MNDFVSNQVTNKVTATPVVQAISYGLTKSIGGVIPLPGLLPPNLPYAAVLESVTLRFRSSLQTGGFWVALFSKSPTSDFSDNTACAIGADDSNYLVDVYHLLTPMSPLGTHTVYSMNGIAKALEGLTASLYAVVVPDAATVALASTSDMIIEVGVIGG